MCKKDYGCGRIVEIEQRSTSSHSAEIGSIDPFPRQDPTEVRVQGPLAHASGVDNPHRLLETGQQYKESGPSGKKGQRVGVCEFDLQSETQRRVWVCIEPQEHWMGWKSLEMIEMNEGMSLK